jgi:glycosyltransferase involved in cell wall biosynthesis
MRILFLVRSLGVGGAQRQLVAVARGLHGAGHDVSVAVFYSGGVFEDDLRSRAIPIHRLGKRGRWDVLAPFMRLVRVTRAERPDVVYAYMGLANQSASLVKPLCRGTRIVWGIRSAIEDLRPYGWVSRITPLLDRVASPLADRIVVNSEAARRAAVRRGLAAGRIAVVPNGFDCDRFRPDPEGRDRQRRAWGVGDAAVVGMVARLDPVKDHATFLRAASRVAKERPEVRFVCVGDGDGRYRRNLEQLATELGLSGRLTWAGERAVTSAVYSALDVAVLSSGPGESFPNVVGEAMACGTPCVVSDSGDAPLVVGETGAVFPSGDATALARAVVSLLDRARAAGDGASRAARARIEQHYSLELLVRRTEEALAGVAGEARASPACEAPGVTATVGAVVEGRRPSADRAT